MAQQWRDSVNFWCVGRNYVNHAKELNNETPTEPIFFLKAGSTLQASSTQLVLPASALSVHHELELAFEFNEALDFARWTLAIDLTDRERQDHLKKKGLPWTLAKSFHGATFLCQARLNYREHAQSLGDLNFELAVDGQVRQSGRLSQVIFRLETLRDYALKNFPVRPGDWLLTGTPAGVGPLQAGQKLEIKLANLFSETVDVVAEERS